MYQRPNKERNFNYTITDASKTVTAYEKDSECKFKISREVCVPLKNLNLQEALKYLNDVIKYKNCVPVTHFDAKCGRTAQVKNFYSHPNKEKLERALRTSKGRWPIKTATFFKKLISNMVGEAEKKNMPLEKTHIVHIQVNQAPKRYGRRYGAFGSVKPHDRKPCHIEIVAQSME